MNKLKGLRFYESGPMDRCTAKIAENWRKDMTSWLQERNAIVFNPVEKPCDVGFSEKTAREEIARLKKEGNFDEIHHKYGKKIRGVDLRMVDVCDVVLLYCNTDIHMVGSYEEAFLAVSQHKPVLTVVEQTKKDTPNWLLFALQHEEIFSSFDELKSYLDYIDKGGEPYSKNRWWFFNQEHLQGV